MMNILQLLQALSFPGAGGVKQVKLVHVPGAFQREVIGSWNQILHFQLQFREELKNGLFPIQ